MTTPCHSGTSESTDPAKPSAPNTPLGPMPEFAELFAIRALLQKLSEQTTTQCQMASTITARQRGDIETILDSLRRFETSLREARSHVDTLGVALDRIKIVALNTGLEGARLGDVAGKALVTVSDELRVLTSRGLELLSEHASTVEQLEQEHRRIAELAENGQTNLRELDGQQRAALGCEDQKRAALARFAEILKESTGLDVEAAERLGRIEEQARGLVESLAVLAQPEHRRIARCALLPALQPLLTWLASGGENEP
jgi:hypothetical protein